MASHLKLQLDALGEPPAPPEPTPIPSAGATAPAAHALYGIGTRHCAGFVGTALTQINNAINCEVMKELNTPHFESTKHQNPQIN